MTRIVFKGKAAVVNGHLTAPYCRLEAIPQKSLLAKGANPSLHDNAVIHGDNLRALKALLPTHSGRVNCVYIDPPYNTGKEGWQYNDRVNNEMMRDWLGKVVDREDLTRHDKWLCMMWPRLSLLRELLAEDGVIFVSIDDNEAHRLRMMMDEIFGDDNFVAQIVAQTNPRGRSLGQYVAQTHEYVLVYAKNMNLSVIQEIPKSEKTVKEYNKEDSNGKYRLLRLRNTGVQFFNKETRRNLFFPIYVNPGDGTVSLTPEKPYSVKVLPIASNGVEGCWTWGKPKAQSLLNLLVGKKTKGATGGWRIYRKDYLPANGGTTKAKSVWLDKDINHEVGKEMMSDIFNGSPFEYPKSPKFIARLINLACGTNGLVLDSFAGSGTTAQAVLELNKEDGGGRKFVLVECEQYADKITAERVRRIIRGVKGAKDAALREGCGGNFGFWQLSAPMQLESILKDGKLPSFEDLAGYVFYTATGEQWNPKRMKKRRFFVGESRHYEVYMLYKPEARFLRETALTLEAADALPKPGGKWRLVFAPVRFAHIDELGGRKIKFCQLPYEIYRMIK